jgi:hypothetical protein
MVKLVKENKSDFLSDFPLKGNHIISGENIFALERAVEYVCESFGVTNKELVGRSRERRIVLARHAFCSLIINVYNVYLNSMAYKGVSLKVVGWRIKKHHSSVLHSCGDKCHVAFMYSHDDLYEPFYKVALHKFMLSGAFEVGIKRSQFRVDEINRIISTLSSEKARLLERINGERL